jgi:hypothetical protein
LTPLSTPSTIDNLTGLMRMPLLAHEGDLFEMLTGGGPSREHVMSFMHEATHHMCFRQTLGNIIAGLEIRASSAGFVSATSSGAKSQRYARLAYDCARRAKVATELLRPLAEGLALFGEFDAFSGASSDAMTELYMATRALFIEPNDPPLGVANLREDHKSGRISDDVYTAAAGLAMANLLMNVRTDGPAVDRKESLLLQPLTPQVGGYLMGYLAVKRLYWQCVQSTHLLLGEPDLYQLFLCPYVYSDPVLAATLVNFDVDAHEAVSDFANRLQQRLYDLPNVLTETAVRELEVAIPRQDAEAHLRALAITTEEQRSAMAELQGFIDGLEASVTDEADPTVSLMQMLMFQRRYLYLGELEVDVTFAGHQASVSVPGRGSGGFRVIRRDGSGDTASSVHLISPIERIHFPIAAVFEQDDDVVAVVWGVWTEDRVDDLTHEILYQRASVRTTRDLTSSCRDLVNRTLDAGGFRIHFEHLMGQVPGTVERIYLQLAIGWLDDAPATAEAMRSFGLGGLLGDPDLVTVLARLGLASSVKNDVHALAQVFELREWGDINECIRQLALKSHDSPIVLLHSESDDAGFFACSP